MNWKQPQDLRSFTGLRVAGLLAYVTVLILLPAPPARAGAEFTLESARAAATNNDAPAEYFLARCYAKGTGVPRDFVQAAEYMRQAAEQGLAAAQNDLGAFYARGRGVKQDYAEAARWYRRAAEQGDALAEYSLGRSLLEGRGVPTNIMEGLQWYQKAAAQNQPDALLALGDIYLNGSGGIQVDRQAAAVWFEKAVAQGRLDALNSLGFIYEQQSAGSDGAANLARAVNYYREAAEKGDARGQMNLGRMYFAGFGVKSDPVEAYKWFYLAAQNGEGIADHYLKLLNGADPLTKQPMTPEQTAAAVQRANDFLKDHPKKIGKE